MNKDVMRKLGFKKEVEAVERQVCPFCGRKIELAEFRDPLSLREYGISGLCQVCQDKVFGVKAGKCK